VDASLRSMPPEVGSLAQKLRMRRCCRPTNPGSSLHAPWRAGDMSTEPHRILQRSARVVRA